MLSDASQYSSHRSMQTYEAELFLSTTVQHMDWSHPEEDVVMDIGCGSGDSSRDLIFPRICRVKKLIAVDIIPEMIEFAQKNTTHDRIEYHVADIENK